MRVAVVTPYLPWPADTGGKLRSYYLIRGLAQAAKVDLYTVCYGTPPDVDALAGFCCKVDVTALTPPPVLWPQLRALTQQLPRSVTYFRTPASMTTIRQKLAAKYDLLVADEISMAPYVLDLPGHAATPKVIMRQKIDHLHYAEVAQHRPWNQHKLLDWQEARRLKHFESATMPRFQGAVVCSQDDAMIAARQGSGLATQVIVNGADVDYFVPHRCPDPDPTLLLLGTMHYQPNIDSALYFFQSIYPALKQALPRLQVFIVGQSPTPEIVRLGLRPGVTVTGSVPDVRPYMSRSWLLAVPLRLGGGTRLKIVEALAAGLPVVSTTVGAQGLRELGPEALAIADTPADFIATTVALLNNAEERQVRGQRGRPLVEQHYSWRALGQEYATFCRLVAQKAGVPPSKRTG